MKKQLLSFIGTNDAGKLIRTTDGAILTALKNESFDEVKLIWNDSIVTDNIRYSDIMLYLKREIKKRKLCSKVDDEEFEIKDVTDHNEIYKKLKNYCDNLPKNKNIDYTAVISSGTPAMQVSWILLSESGDFSEKFPLHLIKVKDPKFGKSKNIAVKLDTGLPRIIGLKEEVEKLKKDLIPIAELNIEKGKLFIGNIEVKLSPMQFCYFRYFAERVIDGKNDEKISGYSISLNFMRGIYKYHKESFEFLESARQELEIMIKKKFELGIQTFRGNVSKTNKKIRETLHNETLAELFSISVEGGRGAKFYGIKAEKEKIVIEK